MTSFPHRRGALVLGLLLAGCSHGSSTAPAPPAPESQPVNGARSPAGEPHPGTILNDDKVDGRTWTEQARDVPPSLAWVNLDGTWVPVVRIEITGTRERRRIAKYGPDGKFLEATEFTSRPR